MTSGTPAARDIRTSNVRVRGKGSGVRVDQRVYNVLTLRDGRIARIEDYSDRSKSLEAAGLRE